jgi:predicted nuclease of predicted toxin-antitoxin system
VSLRFFADHCVSTFIIQTLRGAGHEVLRLRDHARPDSPDGVVISKAQEADCILVSLNGDFSDIITYPPGNYQGIIALQVRNHPETVPQMMVRLMDYLEAHPTMEHYKGKLFLVEVHRIRIRE